MRNYTSFVVLCLGPVKFEERPVKNVTITLDPQTAAWIRVQAARLDMSVSRFVGELLHKQMTDAQAYEEAMRRFLDEKPFDFEWIDAHHPAREELHDRLILRRY